MHISHISIFMTETNDFETDALGICFKTQKAGLTRAEWRDEGRNVLHATQGELCCNDRAASWLWCTSVCFLCVLTPRTWTTVC